jgi:predicted glycoside hydrolase/deacetylase ChbG (UPF0249 family)
MRTAGFNITHADSHHHIHTGIFIVPTVVSVLKKFNIQKIRIHRNLGNISMPKKLIKIIYNTYLTMHGFIMVDRFGGFDDLAFLGAADGSIIEVMVHPDYNETGMLVDNTEYDVNAVSKSLQDRFNQLGSCHLYSYLELSK